MLATILRIVRVAIGLAAIFLAVLAAARLLEHTDPAFREMLTALSTLVLVLVTGVYVYLTFRLVRAQERPLAAIRLAAQESAVRALISVIIRNRPEVVVVTNRFPLDLTQPPPTEELLGIAVFDQLGVELAATASQLPGPLVVRCLDTAEAVVTANINLRSLASVLDAFQQGHAQGYWNWDEARVLYYADIRDRDHRRAEWEDIINGTAVREADAALGGFRDQLVNYLHPAR